MCFGKVIFKTILNQKKKFKAMIEKGHYNNGATNYLIKMFKPGYGHELLSGLLTNCFYISFIYIIGPQHKSMLL